MGHPEILEIDATRFEVLKRARRVLLEAFAIEEKYEILLANYIAFEQEVLQNSAAYMIKGWGEYEEFYESRLGINVCLVNMLTAARLYVDQFPRHVRACLPDSENGLEKAKALLREAHDSSFNYRFMEALRNYVQHIGLPVHRVSVGAGGTSDGSVEFGLAIVSNKNLLAEDSEFKRRVLDECPEEVDLMIAARSYMGSLGGAHNTARKLINAAVELARQTIERERAAYESEYSRANDGLVGLEAQAIQEGALQERIPLLLEWDDIRRKLNAKNIQIGNLSKRYVSGRSRARRHV